MMAVSNVSAAYGRKNEVLVTKPLERLVNQPFLWRKLDSPSATPLLQPIKSTESRYVVKSLEPPDVRFCPGRFDISSPYDFGRLRLLSRTLTRRWKLRTQCRM
jgi:hypothetical protein